MTKVEDIGKIQFKNLLPNEHNAQSFILFFYPQHTDFLKNCAPTFGMSQSRYCEIVSKPLAIVNCYGRLGRKPLPCQI